MFNSKAEIFYALMALTFVLVSTVLSRIMEPWQAWFIAGVCGGVPMWFSLPSEKRIWWKAVLAGLGAGSAGALVVFALGK
ncbi:MAG: hypothetical protein WBP29_14425 [Candidatus Zixiibacteriota bacterium]